MKTTVTPLEDNQVRLEVEVAPEELTPALDRAARELGRNLKLKGFRPGKVPRKVLERHVGREAIVKDAVPRAVPEFLLEAVQSEEIDFVGRPEIGEVEGGVDGPLTFSATLDLRPEVTVGDVSEIEVRLDGPVTPTEEEINSEIDAIRGRYATLETVSRGARTGDHVLFNMEAHVHDEQVDELTRTDLLYEVGTEAFVPELDRELTGASPGAILKFNAEMPAAGPVRPGEELSFTVLVKEIKEKILPELTDEWVDENSEFDTVEEMRAELEEQMAAYKLRASRQMAQERAVQALVERCGVKVPQSVVDLEVEQRLHEIAHQLAARGGDLEQYLEATGESFESLHDKLAPEAEQARAADFVLSAYAEEAGISASDPELDGMVAVLAAQSDKHPKALRKDLERSGRLEQLAMSLSRQKALAQLLDAVTVRDDVGEPVDLSLPEAQEDAIAEAAIEETATAEDGAGIDEPAAEEAGEDTDPVEGDSSTE